MQEIELERYDNGPKRHWRRTGWNAKIRAAKLLRDGELVLYLPGENDFDRVVATEKGIPELNLVAVDKDRSVVDGLRAHGKLAICGDILEIAGNMRSRKIGILSGDFTCDVNSKIASRIIDLLYQPQMAEAVLHFNFLRGRWSDGEMKSWREEVSADYRIPLRRSRSGAWHRGDMLSFLILKHLLRQIREGCPDSHEHDQIFVWCQRGMGTWTDSYFSHDSGQRFDSVGFRNPIYFMRKLGYKVDEDRAGRLFDHAALRKKIAAFFAHRTRKLH